MKALITGGLGFVGRHLTKRLLGLGYTVDIVDNMSSESALYLEDWPTHLLPTEEEYTKLYVFPLDCREFFKPFRPTGIYDEVYHLAAVVGGRQMIEGNPMLVATDLAIDADFFYWASTLPYKPKIYYFSSSAAYPISMQGAVNPTDMLEEYHQRFDRDDYFGVPDLTYGWAKLTGEFLAQTLNDKYGIDVCCFRPFSGYGEDQHDSYPFPALLKRVLKGEDPLKVWGSGEQKRDFIYIEDCIDGILQLGPHITDGSAINLSTGIGVSFNTLAIMMWKQVYGNMDGLHISNDTDKPQGVYRRVGSAHAQWAYDFVHKTTLEEGIKICIEYVKSQSPSIHTAL